MNGFARDLELEDARALRSGASSAGALDDRRFEHLDLAAVEGQAGAELRRRPLGDRRFVDLVVEEQLLIAADDVGDVGDELDAVADERVVGAAARRAGCSCVLSTTELTLTGACFSSGTTIGASNEPIAPLVFSRTTTFTEKRPGGSVTPD